MSFITELRQRKVFRVAIVYLVVAWVAIQAASIALPAFGAPDWMLRVVILLFALGFPLALVLTWALELTPDGIRVASSRVGNRRMAMVSAGLVLLALGWYFLGQPALRSHQAAAAGERSIAVLPFVNMSGDPANEYFSDGLAETTLDMLAQVKDLKVVARTSSFAFKGTSTDVREIGRRLDVAHLLEGSVQQAGDTVRITAQLVRTSDGSHLWSRRFDRRLADVFAIQDEIATEVVSALQMALPAAEQRHLLRKRTEDVAAYQEYLKGIALLPGRKVADMRAAVRHFERAIEIDPGYARAHAAAATTYTLLANYATIDAAEQRRRDLYVERALELAPDLGEAHIVRAARLERAHDLEGAERAFRRGIELAPAYATAYQWYGEFLLFELGDMGRALPMFERALALDPLSPIIRDMHAVALMTSGRVGEALESNARLLADHPEFAPAYDTRARALEADGDLPGALRALKEHLARDPGAITRRVSECRTMLRFGAIAEARACIAPIVRELPDHRDTVSMSLALAAIAGDLPGALALVRRGRSPNEWELAHVLLLNGHGAQAATLLRKLVPELFAQPPADLASGYPGDPVMVGAALLQTGATAPGRRLLQQVIAANAARPHGTFGRDWWDVRAHALLGDTASACAALRDSVGHGYILDLPMLDADPFLADVRRDPCYARALAPARAKASAQVQAARAAGLLAPSPAGVAHL